MKHKLRILIIWYYGRLPLAKLLHKRIIFERLLKSVRDISPIYKYMTPKDFENCVNAAQRAYFATLLMKQQ